MSARPAAVAALPADPGVYRFRDAQGRVLYLGRAGDLRRRVASYWGDLRDRPHLRRMVPQVAGVEAIACASAHEAAWLERNLLERSLPRWNRVRGGLEVPTWIALVLRHETARLAVLHSPDAAVRAAAGDPVFGPYLGGAQSRLAAAGLDRVLSLTYAGDRRGGFDRDMARLRGVADGDLAERVARARAVLDRDAEAVAAALADLARRRADAAAACAFEVAGRIQAELEALAWVTAEQRVTVALPADVAGHHDQGRAQGAAGDPPSTGDVAGWCEGVLVMLEVRAGRLSAWRQREVSQEAARARVAATPAAWRAFAADAAQLAARLRDAV